MINHVQRARDLTALMTIDEKIAQLCSIWLVICDDGKISVKNLKGLRINPDSADPFEAMRDGMGQITRPLGSQAIDPKLGVQTLNRIQHFLTTQTRLKIPALPHEECLAGLMAQGATLFPGGINNGASWDPRLVEEIARAIGDELHSAGSRQGLAPVLDVCRDARWGRTEECLGEDPYLVGVLATAYVRGLQDERRPVAATLKHFVGHSYGEGARNHAPVRIGRRELEDVFLLPFEMAVKIGKALSVMPAYHDLDGIPLHEGREYLQEILRDRWGFDGIVVSDYEGIAQLCVDHKTSADLAGAAAAAIKAGVDVELPGDTVYRTGIRDALDRGLLEMADLDRCVERHLVMKSRMGLFEKPFADEGAILSDLGAHAHLAYKAAVSSMVLLKNDGILPLKKQGKLALIGPLADDPMGYLSGYSFPVHLILAELAERKTALPTLRTVLEEELGSDLIYSRGCDVLTGRPERPAVFPGDVVMDGSAQMSYISYDESRIAQAVAAAREADRIVLAVGDLAGLFLSGTVGEGSDTTSLELPGVQGKLMEAILALGKPTVIVVCSGRPYFLGTGYDKAEGIIQAWLPGQEGSRALVDVLFGGAEPGGRLPVSIPKTAGAMPYFYNHKKKSAGTPIQKDFGAKYPFGFGLSYTDIVLDSFAVEDECVPVDGELHLSLRARNAGKREGDAVVQVYVRDLVAQLVRPVMELKAFQRITLKAGEERRLRFTIPCDILGFVGRDYRRVVEPGDFDLMVGTSSKDILYRHTVRLEGEPLFPGEDRRLTSSCEVSTL